MVIAIKNLDRVIKKFDRVGMVDVKPYITKATQLVQRTAKQMSPKKTGHLKRNINRRVVGEGNTVVGIVYNPVEYASYQEFGTSKMRPHPFMRPALRVHEKTIEKGLIEYLRTSNRRAVR